MLPDKYKIGYKYHSDNGNHMVLYRFSSNDSALAIIFPNPNSTLNWEWGDMYLFTHISDNSSCNDGWI